MQKLEQSVIRVLDGHKRTIGTGFLVSDCLAVTCAHVVQATGSACEQPLHIRPYHSLDDSCLLIAQVLTTGWSPRQFDDVAFLQFDTILEGMKPVVLGPVEGCEGHPYFTLGFASLADYEARKVNDRIDGIVPVRDNRKRPMLQLKGEAIDKGLSGAPILDKQTNRVVGMVSEYQDTMQTRLAWATTAETLVALAQDIVSHHPAFRLWPCEYGPDERDRYLRHLIDLNGQLRLPFGRYDRTVPLERIYVSLRADEISDIERKAELEQVHRTYEEYLQGVMAFSEETTDPLNDRYTEFSAIRKAITLYPETLLHRARDWQRAFAERMKPPPLDLGAIVQQHRYVVLLGDPGSGKTTLGKWLVLQFASALLNNKSSVQVQADQVQPGAAHSTPLNLGSARLPTMVRIADYLHACWNEKERRLLPLETYFERYEQNVDPLFLPKGVTPDAIGALVREFLAEGRTLIVLDGLDEVQNPDQRRAVMEMARRFIASQPPASAENPWMGNRVILTSRIVGYHFDILTSIPHYTVEAMDETAIRAFCQAWMRQVAGTELADKHAARLIAALLDDVPLGVRALAGNPLLLTILISVFWTTPRQTFPTLRVALFERATTLFYEQRRGFWNTSQVTVQDLTCALSVVAFHMQTEAPLGVAYEGDLWDWLLQAHFEQRQIQALLDAARQVSGFLIARGEGVYAFLHRSLQEYFAARYLADMPLYGREQITAFLFDPFWHEPIILAAGIVSHHYGHSSLHQFFDTLLQTPDPIGDVFPRREFLSAAACQECERLPVGIGQQIVERLLALYTEREGRGKYASLRISICQAVARLRLSPASVEVAEVLCAGVRDRALDRRTAAVDLITATQWDTAAIVQALIAAWQTYPDPAASLLLALAGVSSRHPTLFQKAFLPLRETLASTPDRWEYVRSHPQWSAVLRALYFSPCDELELYRMTRDSPLTSQVIEALDQSPDAGPSAAFREVLISLAWSPGNVEARDAVLVLNALGEENWISRSISIVGEQKDLLHPMLATLTFMIYKIGDRARALARLLAYNLDRVDRASSRFGRALETIHTLDLALDIDFARDPDFSNQLDYAYSLSSAYMDSLLREDENVGARRHNRFESRMHSVYALDGDLDRDLDHARALDHTLDLALDRTHSHIHARARDLAYEGLIGDPFNRELALSFNIDLDLDRARIKFNEIEREIQSLRDTGLKDAALVQHLDAALTTFHQLQGVLDSLVIRRKGWAAFVEAYQRHWPPIPALAALPSETDSLLGAFTPDTLETLIGDLKSFEDTRREQARRTLKMKRLASVASQEGIGLVAKLAGEYKNHPLISPQIEWALKRIRHDVPSWLDGWIRQAEATEQESTASCILRTIRSITPEAFETLMQALPSSSPATKRVLLDSMSWLARLDEIPEEKQKECYEQLLNLLIIEQEPTLRAAVIKVLGHWRGPGTTNAISRALLARWKKQPEEREFAALCEALARLARYKPSDTDVMVKPTLLLESAVRKQIHAILQSSSSHPAALAALVRLYVTDNDTTLLEEDFAAYILEKLNRIVSDQKSCLRALLDAGTDDDTWERIGKYHDYLVIALRLHIEHSQEHAPDLLHLLVRHLQQAVMAREWTARRMALAAIAACAEVMPTALQQAAGGILEDLLIRGALDVESSDSRRFALTALGYLRTLTSAVAQALLMGCQDAWEVRQAAIDAASHFQSLQGDILPALEGALIGESARTAHAVARLLVALGTSTAGKTTRLHERIITMLAQALNHPQDQRNLQVVGEEQETLGDALYTALLQVAGWTG